MHRAFSALLLSAAALGLAAAGAPTTPAMAKPATPAMAKPAAPETAELCLLDHTVHPTNPPIEGCIYVEKSNLSSIFKIYSENNVNSAVWPETSIYTRLCDISGSRCLTIKRLNFEEIFYKYGVK